MPEVRLFVSLLSWLSFFAAIWGILLGRLEGWGPVAAAVFFLFLGAMTLIEPVSKDKDNEPSS